MSVFLALAATAALRCPAENAQYRLRHAPEVSASFQRVAADDDWPAGLALAIGFKSGHVYWWLPAIGGTNHRQTLVSTTDTYAPDWHPPSPDGGPRPHGSIEYLAFDAAYDIVDAMPRRGQPAPAHMLIADAGDAEFDHGAGHSVPDTKQLFDLVGCTTRGIGAR